MAPGKSTDQSDTNNQSQTVDATAQQPDPTPVTHHLLIYFLGALALVILVAAILVVKNINNMLPNPLFLGQTPQQRYIAELSKFNNTPTATLNYSVKIPLLSSLLGSLLTGALSNLTVTTYKDHNSSKVFLSIASLAQVAIYKIPGLKSSVICTESSILSSYSSGSISCVLSNSSSYSSTYSIFNISKLSNLTQKINYTTDFTGTKTIIGRGCDNFVLKVKGNDINKLYSTLNLTSSYSYSSSTSILNNATAIIINSCLDKQYGYIALLNITIQSYSKLKGANVTTPIIDLQATGFSTTVSKSVFSIPIPFITTNTTCTNRSISISFIPLENSTNTTVLIKNLSYRYYYYNNPQNDKMYPYNVGGAKLQYGKIYKASINTNINSSVYPTLCVNGTCQEANYCYIPYRYSYTSTYYTTTYYTTTTSITTTIPPGILANNSFIATASNPYDYYLRSWELFLDTYPGSYLGSGRYTNNSVSLATEYSGGALYYPGTLIGNHVLYFVITSPSSSYYGNYSGKISINRISNTTFSGVDVVHPLKIVIANNAIVSANTIKLS